jgi:hypothetical protein
MLKRPENVQVPRNQYKRLRKNVLQHDHDILQIIQAVLPLYVLLLSGKNCLLYSSIGNSFKSIKSENKIRTVGKLTGIA